MTALTFEPGIAVSPDEIDRQLKSLWEVEGQDAARASLMNLAIYSEHPDALEENTKAIAELTQKHACRAILIVAQPGGAEAEVQAWITAHCHTSKAGSKTVCCEQITFLLQGDVQSMIPNIVFAHLDSDLPLYLWWQAQFPRPFEDHILTWVDRLIFDSRCWQDFREQLAILREAMAKTKNRLTLRDLNWARTLRFREATAQIFDNPGNLPRLETIRKVSITYGEHSQTTALLLVGWLASQLKWTLRWKLTKEGSGVILMESEGRPIELALESKAGFSITSLAVETPEVTWKFHQEQGSNYMHACTVRADGTMQEALLIAPQESGAALVSEDLTRGTNDRIYLKAIDKIAPML